MNNTQTIRYEQEIPDVIAHFANAHPLINDLSADPRLQALVQLRASQINGCDFCMRMHVREALQHGDTEQRLERLPDWRQSNDYNEREKAALAWAEALTTIDHVTDFGALRARLREHFSDQQIAALTADVAMTNLWNRVNVSRH